MRPRHHATPDPAGRLPATVLRALAAELSDPGRFSRAKAYARDDAVIDLRVDPGVIAGEVQGSRADPYVARLYVEPVDPDVRAAALDGRATPMQLLPDRDELAVTCSCPDGDTSGLVCKHALATLLVFADEVNIEPALLTEWRSGGALDRVPTARPAVRTGRGAGRDGGESAPAPVADVLAGLLSAPGPLPDLPDLTPLPRPTGGDLVTVLLRDTHDVLTDP